jgi:hypothetical protein
VLSGNGVSILLRHGGGRGNSRTVVSSFVQRRGADGRMDLLSHCPGLGGCGDIDGRREVVVFVGGGGGREGLRPTSSAALGGGGAIWRWHER